MAVGAENRIRTVSSPISALDVRTTYGLPEFVQFSVCRSGNLVSGVSFTEVAVFGRRLRVDPKQTDATGLVANFIVPHESFDRIYHLYHSGLVESGRSDLVAEPIDGFRRIGFAGRISGRPNPLLIFIEAQIPIN